MAHWMLAPALLVTMQAAAQSWCEPGALWYHDYPYTAWGDHGYVETRYTGNVLFADSVCETFTIVEHGWSDQTNTPWQGGPYTMYTHTAPNGLIHLWDGSAFDTLFHFGAVPGDRWQFPTSWLDGGTTMIVTDTGHAMVSNTALRYLVVEATFEDIIFLTDTIFERIGPLELYLDISSSTYFLIDGGRGRLRCYSDADLEIHRVEGPCEIGLSADVLDGSPSISIGPNPASDQVNVFGITIPTSASLMDLTGRSVRNWKLSPGQSPLNTAGIPSGSYVLRLWHAGVDLPLIITP